MMVYVERRATGEVSKDLKSLAEICHKLTSERGLGELSVTDHKLTPMVGQDGVVDVEANVVSQGQGRLCHNMRSG